MVSRNWVRTAPHAKDGGGEIAVHRGEVGGPGPGPSEMGYVGAEERVRGRPMSLMRDRDGPGGNSNAAV